MVIRLCRYLAAFTSLVLVGSVVVAGQDVRPAEQAYKNIKVMKGLPANQIIQGMHVIKAALGVDCTYCHVEGQFDRDDVALKDKARFMFAMMTDLNRNTFGGKQVVTCYTCHKGHAIPENMPSMPVPPTAAEAQSKPTLPAVEQVIAKYVTALGGEPALRKVTSRVVSGNVDLATGPGGTVPVPATLERSMKAPNLVLEVDKADKFTISNGFDGMVAWARGQNGNVNSPAAGGVDANRARRAAALLEPLTLAQQYPTMTVDGIEKIDGRDAVVVTGTPAMGTPERLYFDAQSGLLLRKWTYLDTAVGKSPYQVDYSDYRDTGSGTKIPFTVRMTPSSPRLELGTLATLRITRVRDNVPLDDATFAKPVPAPAAPRP